MREKEGCNRRIREVLAVRWKSCAGSCFRRGRWVRAFAGRWKTGRETRAEVWRCLESGFLRSIPSWRSVQVGAGKERVCQVVVKAEGGNLAENGWPTGKLKTLDEHCSETAGFSRFQERLMDLERMESCTPSRNSRENSHGRSFPTRFLWVTKPNRTKLNTRYRQPQKGNNVQYQYSI